jgi:hypothetical protein
MSTRFGGASRKRKFFQRWRNSVSHSCRRVLLGNGFPTGRWCTIADHDSFDPTCTINADGDGVTMSAAKPSIDTLLIAKKQTATIRIGFNSVEISLCHWRARVKDASPVARRFRLFICRAVRQRDGITFATVATTCLQHVVAS